jgi:hypothetical protein
MRITRGQLKRLIREAANIGDPDFDGQANFTNLKIGANQVRSAVVMYMGKGSNFTSAIEQSAIADFGNMLDEIGVERGSEQAYEAAEAYVDSFMDYIDVSPANWRQMLPEQSEI